MLRLIYIFLLKIWIIDGAPSKIQADISEENLFTDISKMITEILVKIKVKHCYTIITDDLYSNVLTVDLFESLNEKPLFVQMIKDSADPLEPDDETIQMWESIKLNTCEAYVIFLANGIQMERFMRFADIMRILKPSSKYLILHDYRLFAPPLHYIWRRFINVVFIRPYSRKPILTYEKAGRLFELSTVPFPNPLHGVFVLRQLDFWQAGRFHQGKNLFIDRTRNLLGQHFKAVVFAHTPAVMREVDGENVTFSGLEMKIMSALQKVMNFNVEYYQPYNSDEEKWGEQNENGTYNGLLKEMDEGNADFALADLYYTSYHLQVLDLMVPHLTECLTFLTPEATSDNSWKTLILPFSGSMWAGVLCSLFSTGFIFYGVSQLYKKLLKPGIFLNNKVDTDDTFLSWFKFNVSYTSDGKETNFIRKKPSNNDCTTDIFDNISSCILNTYSMLLYVSLPKFPMAWSLRILTGWYWIYCILIVVAYRASMTAILSNPFPRFTIDTIEQLANSKIEVGIWGNQNKGFFLMSQDKFSQELGKRAEHYTDPLLATQKVSDGTYSFYENEYFLKEMRSKVKASLTGLSLHVMSECAVHMPVSIGLERNSPLKRRCNKYVRRLIEAGLVQKWLMDTVKNFEASKEEPPPEALMDLKKLYGSLIVLLTGYFLGSMFLLGEILYWKYFIERHPLYDKYTNSILYPKNSIKAQ